MSDTQPELDEESRWAGLMRASILSATTNKLYSYITLADQKAMGLIILNSIIAPVALNGMNEPDFKLAATISVITSVASMFFAIVCIFPKRSSKRRPKGVHNLLHFADIGAMKEAQYLALMQPVYNDRSALGLAVLKDIHDVSRRVLIPKFGLLKKAYIVFFFGNLAAVAVVIYRIWIHNPYFVEHLPDTLNVT